jgi:hypothetical protein
MAFGEACRTRDWPMEKVVGETGFEPATLCSQSRCATRLRHSPTIAAPKAVRDARQSPEMAARRDGGPGRIRTYNLAVMSGQLYR